MAAEIFLVQKFGSSGQQGSYAARCHAGVLHVGDEISTAMDPQGSRRPLNVRCVEIRLNENIMVGELATNYGGLVVLEGTDAPNLSSDWTLYVE